MELTGKHTPFTSEDALGTVVPGVPVGFALSTGRRAHAGRTDDQAIAELGRRDVAKAMADTAWRPEPAASQGPALRSQVPVASQDPASAPWMATASQGPVYSLENLPVDEQFGSDNALSADDLAFSRDATALRLELLKPIGLTDKEAEVAALLLGGVVYSDIAERLGISASTVKYHAKNIYIKAGVQTKREFLRKYAP